MPLVSERDKQTDLGSVITAGADNYETGLTTETHHRLASDFDVVNRRTRREVMGDPFYYAEILPSGSPTGNQLASGSASAVEHAFEVWLIYEFEESDTYSGSTQETFDNITEGLSPNGILPKLREESVRQVSGKNVTYREPTNIDKDILPLGSDSGTWDRAHILQFEIAITEPS